MGWVATAVRHSIKVCYYVTTAAVVTNLLKPSNNISRKSVKSRKTDREMATRIDRRFLATSDPLIICLCDSVCLSAR